MARFVLPGRAALVFLASEPGVPAAPTQAELTAGTDLIGTSQAEELAEIEGFQVESSTIATPGYASLQVGNVGGDQTYPDSRLAFYKDDTIEVIYDALIDSAVGFVAIMYDGQVAAAEIELFGITVLSRVRRPERAEAHIWDANLAIGVPVKGVQAA